jgi:hypothetical protein
MTATTRHGTSASLFTASFHWPHRPEHGLSGVRVVAFQLQGHCHWSHQGRGPTKPHHAPKRGQAHSGGTRCRTNRLEFFVRVSLYPCPNLLARSRASNQKQRYDPLRNTDRVTLRKAYWEALQRTGQNCSAPWIARNEKGTRFGSLSLQSRSCSADYALGAFWAFQACLHSCL